MLKTLIKKQLLELNQFYFQDKKTGKFRSKAGTFFYVLLFVFVFASIGLAVLGMADTLGDVMLGTGLVWLYFAIMGLMSIFLGVFGSVFNTYAGLYLAKDNEQLLAMPIPPSKILLSRMVGVYAMGLLYSALVWVPSVIKYWTFFGKLSAAMFLSPVLLLFVITLLVSAFTCLLGWLVAMLSRKVKGKSFITVLLSLLFFAGYYYVYFNLIDMLKGITAHLDDLETVFHSWLYPMFLLGHGAEGELPSFLIFTVLAVALFAVCWAVMSRNFVRIVTTRTGEKKQAYKRSEAVQNSASRALLFRELQHYAASPTWMLNTGLGVIILPVAAVFALIKADSIKEILAMGSTMMPWLTQLVPAAIVTAVCMVISMNAVTAASVSLEGKSVWILQSLPVSAHEILKAKVSHHVLLNSLPAVAAAVLLGIVFEQPVYSILMITIICWLYVYLTGQLGIVLDISRPNLNWTSEVVPVKQGLPVFIMIFGGWALSIAITGIYWLVKDICSSDSYLLCTMVIMIAAVRFLDYWLRTKGTAKWNAL